MKKIFTSEAFPNLVSIFTIAEPKNEEPRSGDETLQGYSGLVSDVEIALSNKEYEGVREPVRGFRFVKNRDAPIDTLEYVLILNESGEFTITTLVADTIEASRTKGNKE